MIPHKLSARNQEPKLKVAKEPTPTYANNYVPISRDYEKYEIKPSSLDRECCHVTESEKNHMLLSSALRIQKEAPEFKEVIN